MASSDSATATAADSQANGVTVSEEQSRDGGTFEFTYSWPAEVSAEPELAAILAKDRDQTLAAEKAKWEAALADSPADCVPCRSRSLVREWSVVADLTRYLSLSSEISAYTGGAHGNYGTDSVIWDRHVQKRMRPIDFFTSGPALEAAIATPFCSALNRMRERRRGEPVTPEGEGMFHGCPTIGELTVLLGSSGGKTFDRIGLIADPYVAGSFAEGSYEVTVPVTPPVLDAVKPDYQGSFSLQQ